MNIRLLLISFLIICSYSTALSQKIKYKDLFVLLNARQFEQAEPFLKKYLKDNDDNPNAYIFMGLIYQDRGAKLDMLKATRELVTLMDSAVYFYGKAYKGITEKEISRNDEYYQMYNRRDLRTGKFGVTLSDVQLDLENRMKLKDRNTLILTLKSQLMASESYYKRAQKIFATLQSGYNSQKEFYLQADEKVIETLGHLGQLNDSSHIAFNDYKATAQQIGKTGYNQDLDPQEIVDLKKDGITEADFYHDDLKVWDYKRWAMGSIEMIEKEIKPLKEQLVSMDVEINKAHQKLKKDSVSVRPELVVLRSKMDFAALRKIDVQPFPLKIFEMKLAELDYGSRIVEDKVYKDSINITVQVNALRQELSLAKRIDSLAVIVTAANLEAETLNYNHFVTTAFGSPTVLKSLISGTKDFGEREVARKTHELKRKEESLRWVVDGTDSIPLFNEVALTSKFRPQVIQHEKFTSGLKFIDSLASGYFYTITPTRRVQAKALYHVDQQAFKKRNLPFTKVLSTADEKGQVYFILIFSEVRLKEKFPATLTKVYKVEGLAWSIDFSFDQLPEEIVFSPESFELAVKTRSSIGEMFVLNFDKSGKVIK